jgi:hypothetical protein
MVIQQADERIEVPCGASLADLQPWYIHGPC